MKKQISLIGIMLFTIAAFAGGYKVGDEARDFSLKNIDGKMVSMKNFDRAKGIILVFTCNHCPFAKAYEDRIIQLDQRYAEKGYPVIAINPNDESKEPTDSYANMITRAKEKGFTFPYLRDESQEIVTAYGATKTPHVFLLNKENGKYIVRYIGAIDNNTDQPEQATARYVEDAINALMKGQPVPVTETKAIGCTIKWKGTK